MNRIFRHIRLLIVLLGCTLQGLTHAAQAQTVGEWNLFPSSSYYTRMVEFEGQLYILSDGNVFTFDTLTCTFDKYSRLEGLTGADVRFLEHSVEDSTLAIVYSDGNIDLVDSQGKQYNIPDLKNKTIIGDKTLTACHSGDGRLYISAGFGFVVVDVARREIADSFNFGESCDAAFIFGDRYYMSLASGTWFCPITSNAYDRDNWQRLTTERITDLDIFSLDGEEHCWLTAGNKRLYRLTAEGTLYERFPSRDHFTGITEVNGKLFMTGNGYMTYDLSNDVLSLGYGFPLAQGCDIAQRDSTSYYLLHHNDGIYVIDITELRHQSTTLYEVIGENYRPQGIATTALYNLNFHDGVLAGVSGAQPQPLADQTGVLSYYIDDAWHNVGESQLRDKMLPGTYFRGLSALAKDPLHPDRYYVGSFRYGMFHIEGDSLIAHYNHTNSNISYLLPDYIADYVSAIYPEPDGTLWYTNGTVSPNLKCRTASGKWLTYPIAGFDGSHTLPRLFRGQHDPYRFLWVLCSFTETKCALYYDGGTPEDISDDDCAYFSSLIDQDGKVIKPMYFNDIVEDHNGHIWLLTTSGPFVIESPLATFKKPGLVRRIKIPRNDGTNLADYLLADVNTTCIAIDAANRKWIGTQGNGLYLISADGLQTIHHFTTANAPLMSDNILSLAIDDATGTLYISTEGGVVSYVSDAVEGSKDLSKVYCWPNPVRPEYDGELHISGLMDGTEVRITDVQNNVIYATTSVGGMATWNLRNASGARVKGGVYLVYGYNEEGEEGVVTKFLVIR